MPFRRRLAVLALLFAVAACSTQGDSGTSTAGQGAGAVDRTVTGATTTPAGGGGGAALREALSREGVDDHVLFATDSASVGPEARRTVERWAQLLRQYGAARAIIEGHCDDRGTREYNLALGDRRASAVKSLLVSLGIPAARLESISYGKEKPAVVGSTDAAWAQNRRGVLALE